MVAQLAMGCTDWGSNPKGARFSTPVWGVNWPGHGINHTPLSSVDVKELYLYSISGPSWPVLEWTLPENDLLQKMKFVAVILTNKEGWMKFTTSQLHGYTVHWWNQTLYCPTNAHNVKNVELLKQFKIKEAAPTCFGLQGNHHQGATAST